MTRRTRSFEDASDEDVIRDVVSAHGLTASIDVDGPTHHHVAQANQSDLAFIRDRARLVDADVWIDGSTVHVVARGAARRRRGHAHLQRRPARGLDPGRPGPPAQHVRRRRLGRRAPRRRSPPRPDVGAIQSELAATRPASTCWSRRFDGAHRHHRPHRPGDHGRGPGPGRHGAADERPPVRDGDRPRRGRRPAARGHPGDASPGSAPGSTGATPWSRSSTPSTAGTATRPASGPSGPGSEVRRDHVRRAARPRRSRAGRAASGARFYGVHPARRHRRRRSRRRRAGSGSGCPGRPTATTRRTRPGRGCRP